MAAAHIAEALVAEIAVREFGQRVAGLGAGYVDCAHAAGDIRDVHTHAGTRQPPLQPLLHELDVAGRGGDEIVVFANSGHGAVIQNDAGFVADDAVARASHAQIGEAVGVDLVEKLTGVPADDVELAERAQVNETHALPDRPVFLLNRFLLAVRRAVVEWPFPLAHVHPDAADFVVFGVHGRALDGMEVWSGQRAKRYRRRGRPRGGSAGFFDSLSGLRGADAYGGLVAHLALAGTHGCGGVPLERFNMVEAFVDCGFQVVKRNILTGTHEDFLRVGILALGDADGRRQALSGNCAYRGNPCRQVARHEHRPLFVPCHRAAGLRHKPRIWHPIAAHDDEVAGESLLVRLQRGDVLLADGPYDLLKCDCRNYLYTRRL